MERRVRSESLNSFRKAKSEEALRKMLKRYKLFVTIPGYDSLVVDSTSAGAESSALTIIEHFGI